MDKQLIKPTMFKQDGHLICVSDPVEEKNYIINKHMPMVAVYKKRGKIPRFKFERIFNSVEELTNHFERVRKEVLHVV